PVFKFVYADRPFDELRQIIELIAILRFGPFHAVLFHYHCAILHPYLNSSGKRVLMPSSVDITTTTMTIDQFIIFSHLVLTCLPMSGSSFSNKIKKTSAAGSRVTATTCTNMVIMINGAPGIRTTAPEVNNMRR